MTNLPHRQPFRFAEHHVTRHPAGLVERRLVANLLEDPLDGRLMLDLRVWQRDALSAGELQPSAEAITLPVSDWPTLAATVCELIAGHLASSIDAKGSAEGAGA